MEFTIKWYNKEIGEPTPKLGRFDLLSSFKSVPKQFFENYLKVARNVSAIAIPLMFTPQFAYAAAPDFDFDDLPVENPAVALGAGVALLVAGRYLYT